MNRTRASRGVLAADRLRLVGAAVCSTRTSSHSPNVCRSTLSTLLAKVLQPLWTGIAHSGSAALILDFFPQFREGYVTGSAARKRPHAHGIASGLKSSPRVAELQATTATGSTYIVPPVHGGPVPIDAGAASRSRLDPPGARHWSLGFSCQHRGRRPALAMGKGREDVSKATESHELVSRGSALGGRRGTFGHSMLATSHRHMGAATSGLRRARRLPPSAEKILFVDNPDSTTTAILQIDYAGPSRSLGWVIPVPGKAQGRRLLERGIPTTRCTEPPNAGSM